jgi:hypothetical protein
MERVKSDVKIEHKVAMTQAEAAQWLTDVAKEPSGEATVTIRLADSTVELPDNVRFEARGGGRRRRGRAGTRAHVVDRADEFDSGSHEGCRRCLMRHDVGLIRGR